MRGVIGTVLSQIALVGAQSLNLGSTHPSPTHANITTSLEQAKVPIFQPEGSQLPRKKTGICSQGGRNSEIPTWRPRAGHREGGHPSSSAFRVSPMPGSRAQGEMDRARQGTSKSECGSGMGWLLLCTVTPSASPIPTPLTTS